MVLSKTLQDKHREMKPFQPSMVCHAQGGRLERDCHCAQLLKACSSYYYGMRCHARVILSRFMCIGYVTTILFDCDCNDIMNKVKGLLGVHGWGVMKAIKIFSGPTKNLSIMSCDQCLFYAHLGRTINVHFLYLRCLCFSHFS